MKRFLSVAIVAVASLCMVANADAADGKRHRPRPVVVVDPFGGTGTTAGAQLYHLKSDPGETKNLAGANPAKLQELAAVWETMNRGMIEPAWGHNSGPVTK